MSGVVVDSINFCFEALKINTLARDAELLIDHIPLTGRCKKCGNNFQIKDYIFRCNACNDNNIEIISGRELFVDELEVE